MNYRLILIALVLLGIAGGGAGVYLFNKKVASTQDLKADFTLGMKELYAAFEKDEKAAFELYKEKVIEVSGTVSSKSQADATHVDLTLGSEDMKGTVAVSLETDQVAKAANIKEGSQVVVRGVCTGINSSGGEGESLLDALGKEVQLKKGIILSSN